MRLSLIPAELDNTKTPDEPGYYPVLSVGGSPTSAVGTWDFVVNRTVYKGKTVWYMQNEFTKKFVEDVSPPPEAFILFNSDNAPITQSDVWIQIIGVDGATESIMSDILVPPIKFRMNVVKRGPIVQSPGSNGLYVQDGADPSGGDIFEIRSPIIDLN